MPATAAANRAVTHYLPLSEAAAELARLTGLHVDYDILRKRIERTAPARLPAPVDRIYLRHWGREAAHLRRQDLPKWAAWLKQIM